MKTVHSFVSLSLLLSILATSAFLTGCATTQSRDSAREGSLTITDISSGLPNDGLWRENLVLADMNGDGFLDIVAPPPRHGKKEESMPSIFLRKGDKWEKGVYDFPRGFSYGGIAVGDINGDGYPDIVLAGHSREIAVFLNDHGKGFTRAPLALKEEFHSRGVILADLNGDGWPDIVAASEPSFGSKNYKPKGLLFATNKDGKDWEFHVPETALGLYAESIAVGDLRGTGNKDLAVAFLTNKKEDQKVVWFGDGKGGFEPNKGYLIPGDMIPLKVRVGDVDGDGRDEVVFSLTAPGRPEVKLSALKWTAEGFKDISTGLETMESVIAVELADIEGRGKSELLVLTDNGLHMYAFDGERWKERGRYPIAPEDVLGAYDLRAGRNKDGSVTIAYCLGRENSDMHKGIKAFKIKY